MWRAGKAGVEGILLSRIPSKLWDAGTRMSMRTDGVRILEYRIYRSGRRRWCWRGLADGGWRGAQLAGGAQVDGGRTRMRLRSTECGGVDGDTHTDAPAHHGVCVHGWTIEVTDTGICLTE